MKNSISILSARGCNDYFPLQVVYEWENEIGKACMYPIDEESMKSMDSIFYSRFSFQLQRIIRHTFLSRYIDSTFNYLQRKKLGYYLGFALYPEPSKNHYIYNDIFIPILLDCFKDTVDKLPEYFKRTKILFITNIEVFDYLKKTPLGSRISYIPLSISDQYITNDVPEKTIDILQLGRQNTVLHSWAIQIVKKHPHIDYVYGEIENDKLIYQSTRRGRLGAVEGRADFMSLLGSARISLVSSPGMDGGEKRTGGFHPVTPRFYESAIKYCYMIGRFLDTPDFVLNEISTVCDRPNDENEFEEMVVKMLKTPFDLKEKYRPFINQHLTSTIGLRIKNEIDKRL